MVLCQCWKFDWGQIGWQRMDIEVPESSILQQHLPTVFIFLDKDKNLFQQHLFTTFMLDKDKTYFNNIFLQHFCWIKIRTYFNNIFIQYLFWIKIKNLLHQHHPKLGNKITVLSKIYLNWSVRRLYLWLDYKRERKLTQKKQRINFFEWLQDFVIIYA